MGGICGIAFRDDQVLGQRSRIEAMVGHLSHRGPDAQGIVNLPGISLGFRRLGIIDLAAGSQPFANEDRTVHSVCNGEIYNFRELADYLQNLGHHFRSRSDAEVIVHLYEEHRLDFVKHLRGMFAIAIWDESCRELILARDRLGIKPLHYALTEEALLFGSEQKAILSDPSVPRKLDVSALQTVFSFGFVAGNQTLIEKIHRVPPASLVRYKSGSLSVQTYWSLDLSSSGNGGPGKMKELDWVDALGEKLTESVRSHLVSDVPVAAWLSPGVDSSTIVAIMRELGESPVETFTLRSEHPSFDEVRSHPVLSSFPGFQDIPNQTVHLANRDFELMPEALWYGEDPFSSATEIASLVLSRETGKNYKVILTGEGSDEVFGGYSWYRAEKLLSPFLFFPFFLRKLLKHSAWLRDRRPGATGYLITPGRETTLNHFLAMIRCHTFSYFGNRLFSPWIRERLGKENYLPFREHIIPGSSGFRTVQAGDLAYRLPDAITHHQDRATMAHGLEARSPFLDHELVEFCAAIPDELKLKGLQEKYILRRMVQNLLPSQVAWRRKRPMGVPFVEWLRGPLPDFAQEALSAECLRKVGYFDPQVVRAFLEEHRSGFRNHGRILAGILEVQVWDQVIRQMKAGRKDP